MSHDIESLWRRIDAALSKSAPAVLATLRGPAKAADLAKLEKELGAPLPDDLKRSWAIHDGQADDAEENGLFGDLPFFSVAGARAERTQMHEIAEMMGQLEQTDDFVAWHALVADGIGIIDGPVKARDHHPQRLPIGSFNGDVFRFVDFDPAPGGDVGQVIEIDPESVSWRVLAPSFGALLARYADALEAGELDWADPDSFAALFPPGEDGVPAWLREHAPPAEDDDDGFPPTPGVLKAMRAGEEATFAAEITRIVGVAPAAYDVRLQIDGIAEPVWAQATEQETKGIKQVTMRVRGRATLAKRPGRHVYEDGTPPTFVIVRFERTGE